MLVPVPMSVKSLLSNAMCLALLWIHNRVLVLNLKNLPFLCGDKVTVQHADLYIKVFEHHGSSIRESCTLLSSCLGQISTVRRKLPHFSFFVYAFFFYHGTTVMTLLLNKTSLYFYKTSYTYIF